MADNTKRPILNKVKQRCLILSPTVKECIEKEGSKSDFFREGDKPIGRGGFGEVWKVVHKATSKVYCIKVISKKSIIEQKMVEQMNREIEIMYSLHHPHIVKLINHFEDDESFYLVMHYASKGQLYTHLKRSGRFDQKVAAQYVRDTIQALIYLHSFTPPIIHRDIKPENILVDADYRVKLADFGWSNYETNDDRITYCGTPEYLAPEMLNKKGHDTGVDIWSIGVLLFELLCGSSPFAGSSQEELFQNIRKHKINWPSDFPPVAKTLIFKILKQNPKDRISLKEILNHAFFEQNPPIYKALPMPSTNKKDILESHLLSIAPENCQKEINKVVEKINNLRTSRTTTCTNSTEKKGNFNANSVNFDNTKINLSDIQVSSNEIIAALNKENSELKKKIEALNNELLKTEQARQAAEKNKDKEVSNLNIEIEKFIKLNKERINTLAELEEKNNKVLELDCKNKSLINELEFLKESKDEQEVKYNELIQKNKKLEEKCSEQKKKIQEATSNNESILSQYQKKLELLELKLFEVGGKSQNDSASILELVNENISEFKKIFQSKISSISSLIKDIKDEFILSENSLKASVEKKTIDMHDLVSKLKKKIDEEMEKLLNIEEIIKVNTEPSKKSKENWLSEQIMELQPYKTKFLNLELKVKKMENEISLLNDKNKTMEALYNEIKKINERKTDEVKIKENQVLSMENKMGELKNFCYRNCPEKSEELSNLLRIG